MGQKKTNRDGFASNWGILVALAGSAVGLGNMWRFPYLVGTNGGAAFILIYVIIALLLALPIMYAEFVIGRFSQTNVYGAFKKIAPNTHWGIIGILAIICCIIVLGFYSVVGGWTMDYLWKSLTFNLVNPDNNALTHVFHNTTASNWQPIGFMSLFVGISGVILLFGVKEGIERVSKILMPILFVMVVILAVHSANLPGADKGLEFLFYPDFTAVNSQTVLDALGQAFLSLSIGFGIVFTYASYAKKDVHIVKTSFLTGLSDTLFAIISGIAIMPAVFAFGLVPGQGPGLVFVTLPYVFSQMFLGEFFAILFFFVLFIAALTSSISLLEVVVAYVSEEFHWNRKKAIYITVGVVLCLGTLCALSQGALSHVRLFGMTIFDLCDHFTANFLMPSGALLIVVFAGWYMKKNDFINEITSYGMYSIPQLYMKILFFTIKYIAPIVISVIMFHGLLQ